MIVSLTPFSLLDYAGKLACIVWFGGCNLRCQYCYNSELIEPRTFLQEEKIFEFLKNRIGLLDGVVCSGGECTLWGKRFVDFVIKIQAMGFCIKIDTNGSQPKVLQSLLEANLIDFVALDFKAPASKIENICGKDYFKEFEESLMLLKNSKISYEVRTTFHSDLLSISEVIEMRDWLRKMGYEGKYYIQGFVAEKGSLGNLGKSNNALLKEIEGIVYRGV